MLGSAWIAAARSIAVMAEKLMTSISRTSTNLANARIKVARTSTARASASAFTHPM
jgi:hypothetical protein